MATRPDMIDPCFRLRRKDETAEQHLAAEAAWKASMRRMGYVFTS